MGLRKPHVLSRFDLERARIELRSLLANAQPDGFVAHVTFWQRERFEALLSTYSIAYRTPYLSDCIQPPLLAEATAAAARGPGGDAFLAEVLPRVRRYYEWLHRVRDPDRDGLIATLRAAGEKTYERVWQLPLYEEFERQIKSDVADVKNLGGRWGGAITAGLFLKRFIGDYRWAHLDIAGPATRPESSEYIPKGASGVGVRLLVKFLKTWK